MLLQLPFVLQQGKRADTLHIKSQLADLLSLQDGTQYWTALGNLLTGKTTRQEFEDETRRLFGQHEKVEEICRLHNTLLLAILFNTTAQSSAPSSRHSGWFPKRKRRGGEGALSIGNGQEDDDDFMTGSASKKRKLKQDVMHFTKKERNRIKALPTIRAQANPVSPTPLYYKQVVAGNPGFGGVLPSSATALGSANTGNKNTPAPLNFQQDYARCQQAALCSDMLCLPDEQTMKDRMSFVAYNSKLTGGADSSASAVMLTALELHLKSVLASALEARAAPDHDSKASNNLTMADLANLLDLQPSILVHPHVGAVERGLINLYKDRQPEQPSSTKPTGTDTAPANTLQDPTQAQASSKLSAKHHLSISIPKPDYASNPFTSITTSGELQPKTGFGVSPKRTEQDEETLRQIQAAVMSASLPKQSERVSSVAKKDPAILSGATRPDEKALADTKTNKKRKDWDLDVNVLFANIL